MRPLYLAQNPTLSRRATHRFFRDFGSAGLDIVLLSLADQMAISEYRADDGQWRRLKEVARLLLEHYFERFAEIVRPEPLLGGRALMEILEIEQGPEIGRLIAALLEAQAAGEVKNRAEAIEYVKKAANGPV